MCGHVCTVSNIKLLLRPRRVLCWDESAITARLSSAHTALQNRHVHTVIYSCLLVPYLQCSFVCWLRNPSEILSPPCKGIQLLLSIFYYKWGERNNVERRKATTHWDTSAMCLCRRDTHRSSSSCRSTSFSRESPIPLVSYLQYSIHTEASASLHHPVEPQITAGLKMKFVLHLLLWDFFTTQHSVTTNVLLKSDQLSSSGGEL